MANPPPVLSCLHVSAAVKKELGQPCSQVCESPQERKREKTCKLPLKCVCVCFVFSVIFSPAHLKKSSSLENVKAESRLSLVLKQQAETRTRVSSFTKNIVLEALKCQADRVDVNYKSKLKTRGDLTHCLRSVGI